MPYITKARRAAVDEWGPTEPGDLAYVLAREVDAYCEKRKMNYEEYAKLVGVVETLKLELVSRFLAPYEAGKLDENGDVFKHV